MRKARKGGWKKIPNLLLEWWLTMDSISLDPLTGVYSKLLLQFAAVGEDATKSRSRRQLR